MQDYEEKQRAACLVNDEPSELWNKALPLLRSPVKQTYFLKQISGGKTAAPLTAGNDALSRATMISANRIPVYAMGPEGVKILKSEQLFHPVQLEEMADLQLEVWRYNPEHLSKSDVVDCLSLYLSLRESNDERIQLALEEMKGRYPWQ